MLGKIRRRFGRFRDDERGSAFVEAIIILPFITLFAAGILEFGNMFWERQQIETGVRDAARYLGRCQALASYDANCLKLISPSTDPYLKAKNIAVYGNTAGTGAPRVPGWTTDEVTVTETTITTSGTPSVSGTVIRVSTDHNYSTSPLFSLLGLSSLSIETYHDQPYIGW